MMVPRVLNRDALSDRKTARVAFALFALAAAAWFAFAQVEPLGPQRHLGRRIFLDLCKRSAPDLFVLVRQSHPPGQQSAALLFVLYLYRLAIGEPRVAFIALNLTAFVAAGAIVIQSARRAGLFLAAIFALALFIISGPALTYAPEGRAYFMALCASLTIAWIAAQTVETGDQGRTDLTLAVSAPSPRSSTPLPRSVAGALGAGLFAEGLLRRRADLIRAGFALGAGATLVFGVWLVFALSRISNLSFLEFTASAVKEAVWYVRKLAVGPNLMALAVATFLGVSALRRELWPLLRVFTIAAALFIALPVLTSFKTPLINGRYWLIGAPLLIVTLTFAMRAHIIAVLADRADRRALVTAAFGALCLLAITAFGFASARAFTETKPIWRGARARARAHCQLPAGSVRVPRWGPIFAVASGAPEAVFLDLSAGPAAALDARAARCPVIGWAEHVLRGDSLHERSERRPIVRHP